MLMPGTVFGRSDESLVGQSRALYIMLAST